jgi:hypothetical protein
LFAEPGSVLRLGAGAQLIIPSGTRADYVTAGRYRGMFRFLAAGDAGAWRYAGQVGVHARQLNEALVPDRPNGSEFLYGISGGADLLGPMVGQLLLALKSLVKRLFALSLAARQGRKLS